MMLISKNIPVKFSRILLTFVHYYMNNLKVTWIDTEYSLDGETTKLL